MNDYSDRRFADAFLFQQRCQCNLSSVLTFEINNFKHYGVQKIVKLVIDAKCRLHSLQYYTYVENTTNAQLSALKWSFPRYLTRFTCDPKFLSAVQTWNTFCFCTVVHSGIFSSSCIFPPSKWSCPMQDIIAPNKKMIYIFNIE